MEAPSRLRLDLKVKCKDLIGDLKSIKQKLLALQQQLQDGGLNYRGVISGSEFQLMSERLSLEAENLERNNIEDHDHDAALTESSNPATDSTIPPASIQSSDSTEPSHPSTSKDTPITPIGVAYSILDSIMMRKHKQVHVPEDPQEAAIHVENILSTAYMEANENATDNVSTSNSSEGTENVEQDDYEDDESNEGSASSSTSSSTHTSIKLQNVEVIVTATPVGKKSSTEESESEDTESLALAFLSPPPPPSQFVKRHRLLEKFMIKLTQLDRKLAGMEERQVPPRIIEPHPPPPPVDEKKKVAVTSKGTQVEPKMQDESIPNRKQKPVRPLGTKQCYHHQRIEPNPIIKKNGERPLTESKQPERTEVLKIKFKHNPNKDATYWKENAKTVLQALVQHDVGGMEFLSKELQGLASPTRDDLMMVPCQDEHGYWATMANKMFLSLLKQKRCNPAVWSALTPYVTMEEALSHLTKERKR